MIRDFFLGFVKIHILHHAEQEPVKVRKYYSITTLGSEALVEARQKIQELVAEVIEGRGPSSLPDPK